MNFSKNKDWWVNCPQLSSIIFLKFRFLHYKRWTFGCYLSTAKIWSYYYRPKDSATYEKIHQNDYGEWLRQWFYFGSKFTSHVYSILLSTQSEATHNDLHASFCFVAPLLKVYCTFVQLSTFLKRTFFEIDHIGRWVRMHNT